MNKWSKERKVQVHSFLGTVQGTNGPIDHSFQRTKVPPWERIVLGTNSLENECSIIHVMSSEDCKILGPSDENDRSPAVTRHNG